MRLTEPLGIGVNWRKHLALVDGQRRQRNCHGHLRFFQMPRERGKSADCEIRHFVERRLFGRGRVMRARGRRDGELSRSLRVDFRQQRGN